MVDGATKSSPLTSSEKVFLFRKASQEKEAIPAELFVLWLDKYSTKKYKPLINLNVRLLGDSFRTAAAPENKVPLLIRRLVEEMHDYGQSHVEDAFSLYVAQSTAQFLTRKDRPPHAIEKPLLLTNLERLFSVLGTPAAIEDLHEIKIWLMENDLAERYVVAGEAEIEIEVVIKAKELWAKLMEMLRQQTVPEGKRLDGNTPDEVVQSMKVALIKKKLTAIESVTPRLAMKV